MLALLCTAAACGGDTDSEGAEQRADEKRSGDGARSASHQRMLDALAGIAEATPDQHPYLGDANLRRLRAQMEELGARAPWQLRAAVARAALLAGNEQESIDTFTDLVDGLESGRLEGGSRALSYTKFQLGISWLRRAETENCCVTAGGEACIWPIQESGFHTRRTGSENARACFLAVLDNPDSRPQERRASQWLLNIAAMTLGEHPDGVPEPWRIPPEAFRSAVDLPRLVNRAADLGVDTFSLSGGVVVDDFDGDLDLDILVSSWDTRTQMRLFRNRGDGTFVDDTEAAGLTGLYGGLNMVQGDYDDDGDVDVLVLRGAWLFDAGFHPNSLLQNDGSGRFTDVTYDVGLAEPAHPTQTGAWADFDLDGDLDLCIGNEDASGAAGPLPNVEIFRNRGDGTFENASRALEIYTGGFVKAVAWGDVDGDRYPDLYVSRNGQPNVLLRNVRGQRFEDITPKAGVREPVNSFPCWFFDHDNDGALDLFVAAYDASIGDLTSYYTGADDRPWSTDRLYRGDGEGGFEDVGAAAGLDYPSMPMGSNFGDVDGDGWLDMYLGTGETAVWSIMPNLLFINRPADGGGRRFVDASAVSGLGHLQKGHAVAFADLDHDGDLDVFEQMGGAYPCDAFADALFENPGIPGHRHVTVQLVGRGGADGGSVRCALGARIRVEVADADGAVRSVYRHVTSGGSFGASPLRQTIGLGQAAELRLVEVYWPTTDATQRIRGVELDSAVRIREPGSAGEAWEELPLRRMRLGGG